MNAIITTPESRDTSLHPRRTTVEISGAAYKRSRVITWPNVWHTRLSETLHLLGHTWRACWLLPSCAHIRRGFRNFLLFPAHIRCGLSSLPIHTGRAGCNPAACTGGYIGRLYRRGWWNSLLPPAYIWRGCWNSSFSRAHGAEFLKLTIFSCPSMACMLKLPVSSHGHMDRGFWNFSFSQPTCAYICRYVARTQARTLFRHVEGNKCYCS